MLTQNAYPSAAGTTLVSLAAYQIFDKFGALNADTFIAFIRSKAVYQTPRSMWDEHYGQKKHVSPCTVDLFTATTDMFSTDHEYPGASSELSHRIVYFYARLLVLRCYEDYTFRHDPEPIHLSESNRVTSKNHPHLLAMQYRRLELVKFKHDLFGYLGPPTLEHGSSGSADNLYGRKLRSLVTDMEMLLLLYDNSMRIYSWHNQDIDWDYKGELAAEQLEEAKQSKATAISLGKLSQVAVLYLPLNFVCAMLGMNLSIFGQGDVPAWVFPILVALFGLLTYLPLYLPSVDKRRIRLWKVAYCLARRSVSAGFWFFAFTLTHTYYQNFEILNSGLAQVLLGYKGSRTKGWVDGRHDRLFERATWGSEAFWKEKMRKIFLVAGISDLNNAATGLTV